MQHYIDAVADFRRDNRNPTALDDSLRLVLAAIKAAPPQVRPEAEAKVAALKQEAAKGKDANDGVIAKLVDGLVNLVPGARFSQNPRPNAPDSVGNAG